MRRIGTLAGIGCLLAVAAIGAQEAEAEASRLALEAVVVEPSDPGPETLCKLRLRVRNDGDETVSQFGFAVLVNGQELPVYRNQLFMYPVEPEAVVEVPLYNFWTTETSRPMPADGKLRLEVRLEEATWMKIETVDEVETWTPLGGVDGLPVSAGTVLELTVAGQD